MKNIAVLVLAAGKASRMNSIKQLEKIDHKTLLDICLEKIKSIIPDTIFCVLGANYDIIKQGIKTENIDFINNQKFETGLSSSIVAGIQYFKKKHLSLDAVFILLADQPAIEISYLKKNGIGSRNFFYPMHKQPILIQKGYFKNVSLPNSEYLSNYGFYIPSGLNLNEIEIRKVAKILLNYFK
jgi:CTP:molybdopterin cytidylyltransferase MocA